MTGNQEKQQEPSRLGHQMLHSHEVNPRYPGVLSRPIVGRILEISPPLDHDVRVSATLTRSSNEPSTPMATRRRPVAVLVGVALAVALVVLTMALTGHVVTDRTAAEGAIQHHRGLALAAMPQLDRALQRALLEPLADRPASPIPWLAGPQLGPGQPDVSAQGAPTIRTTLIRSTPDAVVAKMVVRSDGYQSTIIDKWFDGGAASDACSYSDLPTQWSGGNSAATCRQVVTSVPIIKR